jgi:hemerythrin-like domain-containing protein
MTQKRFVIKPSSIVNDGFVIIDKEKKYTFPVLESTLNYMFCKALNELTEENEERKRAMRIAEYYNKQLEDENKKLKKYLDSISKGGLE